MEIKLIKQLAAIEYTILVKLDREDDVKHVMKKCLLIYNKNLDREENGHWELTL